MKPGHRHPRRYGRGGDRDPSAPGASTMTVNTLLIGRGLEADSRGDWSTPPAATDQTLPINVTRWWDLT